MNNTSEHVWLRTSRAWTAGFWGFMAVATARLLTAGDLSPAARLTALACVATISVAFAGLRPETVGRASSRPDVAYLLIVTAATGVACAADSSMALLLCLVFSQVGMYAPDSRAAGWLSLLLGLVASLGLMTGGGWTGENAGYVLPIMTLSTAFSIGFGRWITRIIDQSAERSQLIRQLEETRAELGRAHHAQGVAAERERVAREIHDTLAQGFTSIVMLAQVARASLEPGTAPEQRLALIEEVARENLGEARSLVAAFAPVGLSGATLTEAVRRLTARFGSETGITAEVAVEGDLTGLTRDREVVLLRAAQEALANVRRHSGAGTVRVLLAGTAVAARIEVSDDGTGFDPADPATPLGFGLSGMRERARSCGGRLDVTGVPGQGTRIAVRVPKPLGTTGSGKISTTMVDVCEGSVPPADDAIGSGQPVTGPAPAQKAARATTERTRE